MSKKVRGNEVKGKYDFKLRLNQMMCHKRFKFHLNITVLKEQHLYSTDRCEFVLLIFFHSEHAFLSLSPLNGTFEMRSSTFGKKYLVK